MVKYQQTEKNTEMLTDLKKKLLLLVFTTPLRETLSMLWCEFGYEVEVKQFRVLSSE